MDKQTLLQKWRKKFETLRAAFSAAKNEENLAYGGRKNF